MFLKMALSPVTPCRRKRADRGPGSAHAARIDEGTDAEICVLAFRRSAVRTATFAVFSLVLCLLPLLVTRWKPFWRLVLTHRPCSLRDASSLYVKCGHGGQTSGTVVPVVCEVAGSGVSAEFLVAPSDTSSMSSDSDLPLVADNNQRLQMRFFWFYRLKYTWSTDRDCFVQLSGLDRGVSVQQLLENYPGYSLERQRARLSLFGENRLYIEVKSYCQLLVAEALNPFYIFQLWSIILWSWDEYYIYAGCILFISVVSIAISLYEIRRQSKVLREMVMASAVPTVTVRRNTGAMEQVDTDDVVPGDVLVLPSTGCCMPCDAALITGSCIVNESMLTGESVPVTKTSLAVSEDSEIYSPEQHKRSTLFCGTQVIQSRCHRKGPVLAVVVRTAFNTAKGELIRSILFPKPMGFKFYRDSIKFVGFLALMASGGMAYTVYLYVIRGASVRDIILRSLDIITVVVPPALPAAMTVGTVYAQNRLKRANIFCISPPRINVCGKLKLFCFDKTGTLTEEGLSTWGVVGCSPANGLAPPTRDVRKLSDQSALKMALASCHGLTRLAGQLIGDPLDVKMFESTGWELEEPSAGDSPRGELLAPTVVHPAGSCSDPSGPMIESSVGGPPAAAGDAEQLQPPEVGIVRQFPFVSEAQRMSVVTRCRGRAGLHLYCKGAPEKIEQLCTSVPADFHEVLHEYTVQGYRVLAVAHRPLDDIVQGRDVQRLKRDQVECDLELCGLLIMQNRLKPETRPVIETLQRADIRCVMVTGDNLLTAVSVGRECGLIPAGASAVVVEASPPTSLSPARLLFSLAAAGDSTSGQQLQPPPLYKNGSQVHILLSEEQSVPPVALENYQLVTTGRSWRVLQQYFPDVIDKLVVRGTIFARMSPDQKAQVVEALQHVGYTVGMCGDGANDCEALRTAHAGISLSEAEASVAAPFTSKTADISCVPTLIREGRAALATSFSTFKYMALYSMIQFVSVLLLYERYSNLSDIQFLYVDLVITTTVAVTMGYTAAAPTLHRRPPPGSLLGPANLISIVAQVGMVGACQVIGLWLLEAQSWYVPVTSSHDEGTLLCWENTVIFCISSYQYLILATAFSRGPPYRRALYTNPLFLVSLLVLTGLQTTLVLVPYPPLAEFFGLVSADTGHVSWPMRRAVIIICAVHFLLALFVEFVVSKSGWVKQLMRLCGLKRPPKNRYHLIEQELRDSCWPPIDRPLLARPLSVSSSDGGR